MTGRSLATAVLLLIAAGCGPIRSPAQVQAEAEAEWVKPGATVDDRHKDYQECRHAGARASARFNPTSSARNPTRSARRRVGAFGRRTAEREFVLEKCLEARGWTRSAEG